MTAKPTFEVDRDGLRKVLARKGKWSAVTELVQNAWDEDTHNVDVTLKLIPGTRRGTYQLRVEDDNPEGFKDLSHAYTLFAESEKKADVRKRGRFNLGEKLVIALCDYVTIQTTKGTIEFDVDGRRHFPRRKLSSGTIFTGTLTLTINEVNEISEKIYSLIPPAGIVTSYNGLELVPRAEIWSFTHNLATEVSDEDGYLRPTRRNTTVTVYPVEDGEPSYLYELGIPVVEIELPWHVDVAQKVPLNVDRDNVTPAYMRSIIVAVANEMAEQIEEEDISHGWVQEALSDPKIEQGAMQSIIHTRYGKDVVIHDPRDPESSKMAQAEGRQVIYGNSLPKAAWDNMRKFESQGNPVALAAPKVTPAPKPYGDSGEVRAELPVEKWTPGMHALADFSKALAEKLMGVSIGVQIVNDAKAMNFSATYGSRTLEFNMRTLGRAWLEGNPVRQQVIDLLIHEFGHEYESDHLSRDYYKALTKLGAKATMLAIQEPSFYDEHSGVTVR